MARDHFIPASVIGRFSADGAASARERNVYVLRRGITTAFRTRAANIGYVNSLYDLTGHPPTGLEATIDFSINGYEPGLPAALDSLDSGIPMDISTWLRILVPYVAGIFVRGQDFIPRFRSRPSMLGPSNTIDNANLARSMELQRLLAPVVCARWHVMHKRGGEPFVLNDLSLTGTSDTTTGESGWAIPISQMSVLGIFPRRHRVVAQYDSGRWWPVIGHGELASAQAASFNRAMARMATQYVIGPDPNVVERLAPFVAMHPHGERLKDMWPIDGKTRRVHADDWHRLVTATARNASPASLRNLNVIDWSAIQSTWYPTYMFLVNAKPFRTGLRVIGDFIHLTLDVPEDYADHLLTAPAGRRSPSLVVTPLRTCIWACSWAGRSFGSPFAAAARAALRSA